MEIIRYIRERQSIIAIGVIIIIVFIVYSNSINNGFTNRDDTENVIRNKDIREISYITVKNFFTTSYLGMYSPLTMMSYSIDYKIGGLNPHVYHLINLLLHLVNCALVYILIIGLTGNRIVAGFSSLMFGIHPMNVDGVSSISCRGSLLYTLFYLMSLIAYLGYIKRGLNSRLREN